MDAAISLEITDHRSEARRMSVAGIRPLNTKVNGVLMSVCVCTEVSDNLRYHSYGTGHFLVGTESLDALDFIK